MTRVVALMNGRWGRLACAVLGLVLVACGLAVLGDTTGLVLAAVGLVPLVLGFQGRCLLEPFARAGTA
jgi:Inner membrane protein YgaP-like, transmembrane domain